MIYNFFSTKTTKKATIFVNNCLFPILEIIYLNLYHLCLKVFIINYKNYKSPISPPFS